MLTGGDEADARWSEVLPRLCGRRALLRRGRPLARRRLLPGRRQRPGRALHRRPRRGAATSVDLDGPTYERWVAGLRRADRRGQGTAARRRTRAAVRRGRRQRAEVLVARRRTPPRHRDGVRRGDGSGRGRGHRLGGRARHHPGRTARPTGAGAGGDDRGRRRAALHLARRRPAPPPPRADQRTRLRARRVAWTALGRRRRQHRGAQRDRPRRRDVRPRVPGRARGAAATRLDDDGEIQQLAPYAGGFSQRAAQINRNVDRYEAAWRAEHPGQEPGPRLRRTWDRRAWADARPDKVVPRSGADLVAAWNSELRDLGFTPPTSRATEPGLPDRPDQPRRRRRPRAHPARRQAVGVERSRHPRRGRTTDRLRRRGRRTTRPARAGRGHRRPCPDAVRAAAGTR